MRISLFLIGLSNLSGGYKNIAIAGGGGGAIIAAHDLLDPPNFRDQRWFSVCFPCLVCCEFRKETREGGEKCANPLTSQGLWLSFTVFRSRVAAMLERKEKTPTPKISRRNKPL